MYKIINRKKLYATIAADLACGLFTYPLSLFRDREDITPGRVRSILVIRTAYIGDVVMTLPVLRPLKEGFPGARLTFLTSSRAAPVLENNPFVDEVITFDPFWFYPAPKRAYLDFIRAFRKRPFDLVIEARGDIREIILLVRPLKARFKVSYDVGGGGSLLTHVVPYAGLRHKVEYHLDIARFLGCPVEGIEWGLYLTDEERRRASALLGGSGLETGAPYAVIHPGCRKALKCWHAGGFSAVADFVHERFGLETVITGAPSEGALVEEVAGAIKAPAHNLAGRTSLRELAAIIEGARLVICNDSSPMHIAAALRTPTVAVFGPSKSVETAPYGPGHAVVEKDFPCRFTCDEDVCRFRPFKECMRAVEVSDVTAAAERLLVRQGIQHG